MVKTVSKSNDIACQVMSVKKEGAILKNSLKNYLII